jgi:hypothetical protein
MEDRPYTHVHPEEPAAESEERQVGLLVRMAPGREPDGSLLGRMAALREHLARES